MTKKDYELIAKAVRDSLHYQTLGATPAHSKRVTASVTDTATRLCNSLASQDTRFKRDQFLKDCGVTD